MRVDYIEDEIVYYTSLMGSGEEMNRLIKRLWKNPYYDFSFSPRACQARGGFIKKLFFPFFPLLI